MFGGNAVAARVAAFDDRAVRNTRDVNILLRGEGLDQATESMTAASIVRSSVMDITVFLDGTDGKSSQGILVLLADRKVREDDAFPTPKINQAADIEGKSDIELEALVEMKFNSCLNKDRTHLRDMI